MSDFYRYNEKYNIVTNLKKNREEQYFISLQKKKKKYYMDGFSLEEMSNNNFFIIEPKINIKEFFETTKKHVIWKYNFSESFIKNVKYFVLTQIWIKAF
jgi:hypothetical protein